MIWLAWIANKHTLWVHLPVAAALMIPIPILAAQRGGRGIRPWWVTCRYLAACGLIGSLLAVASGGLQALRLHPMPWRAFWSLTAGGDDLFRLHAAGGAASVVLGALCLRSVFRPRQDHQGIGFPALLLGLAWCAVALGSAWTGARVEGHVLVTARNQTPATLPRAVPVKALAAPVVPATVTAAAPAADPEAEVPVRALDYGSLKAVLAEPMKSPAHGNRWIRIWVTAASAKAYLAGQPLPPGTLAVLSTVEDQRGRPGFQPGPLYALEFPAEGKPRLTFYWSQVPETRRKETQGAARAYWRRDDPALAACRDCHAHGAATGRERRSAPPPRRARA